jgi:hypothetical protein
MISAAVVPGAAATYFFRADGNTGSNPFIAWIFLSLIAFAHVVLLGIPGALLLKRLRVPNLWLLLPVGFVAGCLPIGIFAWLTRYIGPTLNHKDDMGFILFCGALGVLGALSGITAFVAMRSNNRWRGP